MLSRVLRGGLAALSCLWLCGCPKPPEGQTDEQKNRHYVAGKEKLAALDYKGAIESFERAVEDNPRSALAHFELGVLFETRENDYVSALYHYNRALKLRPNSYPADNINQRIPGCKQELVKADSLGTLAPSVLRETERLRNENQALRKQVEALKAQVAHRPLPTNAPAGGSLRPAHASPSGGTTTNVARGTGAGSSRLTQLPPARSRVHTVKSGETPSSIARFYGVRLDALLAANPGLDPRKLKVGQPLNLPAQ